MIETIENHAGDVIVSISVDISNLCGPTGEPQVGSKITWTYTAHDRLLAIDSLRRWPAEQMSNPVDLETFTRMAADQASDVLDHMRVIVNGIYILSGGVTVSCHYDTGDQ